MIHAPPACRQSVFRDLLLQRGDIETGFNVLLDDNSSHRKPTNPRSRSTRRTLLRVVGGIFVTLLILAILLLVIFYGFPKTWQQITAKVA